MTLDRKDFKKKLDENVHECAQCGRILNKVYKDDLCPECKDLNLFAEVKDYIRENDVKEIDVAEHFGIPVSKVRRWIKEGRIQYKEGENITPIHCQICGKTLDFGSVCPECRRKNGLHIYAKKSYSDDDIQSAMRFLGKSEEGKRY